MAEQHVRQRFPRSPALPAAPRGLSLRMKITIAMLILALAPLAVVSGLVYNRAEQVVLRQVSVDSEAAVRERARQLREEVERLHQLSFLLASAQTTRLVGADMGQRENYLTDLLTTMTLVNRALLVDPDGRVLLSVPRIGNLTAVEVPETARTGRFSPSIGRNEARQPQYQVFAPVVVQGNTRMVLALFSEFRALVGASALPRADDGAFLTVVDRDGTVLYSTRPDWEANFKDAVLQAPQIAAALQGRVESGWSSDTALGDVYVAAAPVAGPNWVVLYAIPSAKALGTAAELRGTLARDLVLLTLILMIVVLILSMLLSRQLVAPVLAVCRVMERVRDGHFDARASVASKDELGTLGNDLNQTLDTLVALVQTREERDALQQNIRRLLDEVSEVATGDLTAQAEVTAGPTGAIADAFNYMIEELRGLVRRTQATTDQVSTEAAAVTALTERLVTSAAAQRRRLEEARAAVTEMTGLMAEVRATVGDAVVATGEAQAAVTAGQQAVGETMTAIGRLRSETRETAMKIKRLGESSQEIGEIVRLINEIADQTHLLALNASIQAAMAGEHGRGFAVVAEEVRALAERSAAATGKIEELIRVIQADTNAAMVAMERSTQEVVSGSRLADKAGNALAVIGEVTGRIVQLSEQIEQLVNRQVEAAQVLETTVTDVAGATVQATDDVRVMAEGMQTLARLAASLRESVSVFRVEPATEVAGDAAQVTPAAA
jgi:methyl-accepting chemotaxis protein